MNPTPNQITECDDERQLCEWLGYALGWRIVDIQGKPHWDKWTEITPKSKWQPTSPTEKGKAQCWDLMMKFKIKVSPKNMIVGYPTKLGVVHFEYWDGNAQIAVVKAAILCAMGDR